MRWHLSYVMLRKRKAITCINKIYSLCSQIPRISICLTVKYLTKPGSASLIDNTILLALACFTNHKPFYAHNTTINARPSRKRIKCVPINLVSCRVAPPPQAQHTHTHTLSVCMNIARMGRHVSKLWLHVESK